MARFTHAKVVNFFQNKGAKIHFNFMKVEDPEISELLKRKHMINIRYGIIELEDLKRDLQFWETLMCSSMM